MGNLEDKPSHRIKAYVVEMGRRFIDVDDVRREFNSLEEQIIEMKYIFMSRIERLEERIEELKKQVKELRGSNDLHGSDPEGVYQLRGSSKTEPTCEHETGTHYEHRDSDRSYESYSIKDVPTCPFCKPEKKDDSLEELLKELKRKLGL